MDRPGSGLRRLTGLLLVVNGGVLLAGWAGSHWQGPAPVQTFNAEKIQMLEETAPEGPPANRAAAGTGATAEAPQGNCRTWPALDAAGVAQVQAHMRRFGVADEAYDLRVAQRLGWWVFIPPLENDEALRVVMEDARSKGVRDMAPVRQGPLRHALALGTFASLAAARQHAQHLERRGLQGVRYGPRPDAGAVRLVVVKDSPSLGQALAGDWPPGLAPAACGP